MYPKYAEPTTAQTVGELRAALAELPDDLPVKMVMEEYTANQVRLWGPSDSSRYVELDGGF